MTDLTNPDDPDVQAYLSCRYVYRPLLIIELPNGTVCVGHGLGDRTLLAKFPGEPRGEEVTVAFGTYEHTDAWTEAFSFIQSNARTRQISSPRAYQQPKAEPLNLDLSDLDLGDLEI